MECHRPQSLTQVVFRPAGPVGRAGQRKASTAHLRTMPRPGGPLYRERDGRPGGRLACPRAAFDTEMRAAAARKRDGMGMVRERWRLCGT